MEKIVVFLTLSIDKVYFLHTWVPVGVTIGAINPKAASVDHICEQCKASGLVSLIFHHHTY